MIVLLFTEVFKRGDQFLSFLHFVFCLTHGSSRNVAHIRQVCSTNATLKPMSLHPWKQKIIRYDHIPIFLGFPFPNLPPAFNTIVITVVIYLLISQQLSQLTSIPSLLYNSAAHTQPEAVLCLCQSTTLNMPYNTTLLVHASCSLPYSQREKRFIASKINT